MADGCATQYSMAFYLQEVRRGTPQSATSGRGTGMGGGGWPGYHHFLRMVAASLHVFCATDPDCRRRQPHVATAFSYSRSWQGSSPFRHSFQ
jgi:hypothetical protein